MMLVAVLTGALYSCSGSNDVLDVIPADVNVVATVNVERLCSEGGIDLNEGGAFKAGVLPGEPDEDVAGVLACLAKVKGAGADVEHVVLATSGKTTFAVCDVKDAEAVRTAIGGEWESSNGMEQRTAGHHCLVTDGKRLWCVMNSGDGAGVVAGVTKRAKEMPVSKLNGLVELLGRDNLVNLAAADGFMTLTTGGGSNTSIAAEDRTWATACVKSGAGPEELVIDWSRMQSTGRQIAAEGMQEINPAVLGYVPGEFNCVVAAGLTQGFDWTSLKTIVSLIGGYQASAFMATVAPYLESIDGTVMLATGPTLNDGGLLDRDFIVMAHLPQDRVNQLMGMIRGMAAMSNIPVTDVSEGVMAVPQYGKMMYIGNVEGYLAISTVGFNGGRQNELAPLFVNKDLGVHLAVSSLSEIDSSADIEAGLTVQATMAGAEGVVSIALTGTRTPILQLLMELMLK